MKNRQKMIIWLMLVALLLSEITHLVSISNQVVWAQEESETLQSTEKQEKTTSTETSVNQIQSGKTTETSQTQTQNSSQQEENEVSSKTQTSTEQTVAESSTKEEVASQTSKTSIQPQAGNVDDNPGAKVAYDKAATYWIGEISARVKTAPKLGNYVGATSTIEFNLPVENAPVTSATSGIYKWDYATSIYFDGVSFVGGDGITFTGSAATSTTNGQTFNHFYLVIKRTKPGSNITVPSISLKYHGELRADEYINWTGGGYVWNKVNYFEKGTVSRGISGLVCNLESVDMPSKYSWLYDEWRKVSVRKIASNLSDALKSNYSKLGKNVNDTVNFTVESKASEQYTGQINFIGDYFSDLSQFKVNLSSNFSNYVQLEKTGSTGTKINYRMKRVKAGNFSGDCSVTINTRHDAEGRTISIYDGSLFYWALPMDNIPLDSASASFNINDDRQIWADVVEQTIELGTWSGEIPAVSKMITNVRLEDGTAINASDYTAEVNSVPSFDNMTVTDKIGVKITRKSSGVTTYVQVPVKMTWGNTIQLRGYDNGTSGAYTLHKIGNTYRIRSSYGENKNYRSNGIHEYRKGMTYQSITLLRGTGRIDQLSSTYYKGFNGEITTNEVVSSFGTNAQQYIQLGDVVQIWHKEQWRNSYTRNGSNVKYSDMDEGSVYFAVTADGFIPYRLNQLKPKETTITMGTTDAELDKQAGDLIDFLGMNGNGLKVSKITEYPDRSKAGTAKGKVLVEETIDGHTYTYEYEVPFKVTDDRQIRADVVEQTVTLGTQADELADASKMVTNVRLDDGTVLNSSDYTTQVMSAPDVDNMKVAEKIEVKVTRKSNNAETTVYVPIKVAWGSTIQLRGKNDQTAGAYTLHQIGSSYYIRSNYGQSDSYSGNGVHSNYIGTPYHSINLLRGSGRIDQLTNTYYKGTNGNVTAKTMVDTFGTNGKQFVQLGDIVQIWHKEQWRNFYTKDETEIKYSNKDEDSTYFAITADGFVPYRLNQLEVKESTILMSTTNEELDQKKDELIDFLGMNGNGLKVTEITQYPDRSKPGKSTGKVLVEETIGGVKLNYEYEVTFNVTDDRQIWADVVEQTVELGTQADELTDASKMVTNVRLSDGTVLAASDYTTQVISVPDVDNMKVTGKIEVKVTRKSNNAETTVYVPIKVIWGNTIQIRGRTDQTAGAYTLRKKGNSYSIQSSFGMDKEYRVDGIHSIFPSYYSMTLLRGDGKLTDLTGTYYKENTGNLTTDKIVNDFGTNGQQSVQLGDVVKIWHKEQWRNFYTKDEKEIQYSGKNEDIVYFLVTANGFVPYRLNQLEAKESTILMSTTNEELDQKKDELIDFLGMTGNGLKVTKMTQYPDRSKAGKAVGKVLVEETIEGITHTYEYEVTFNVLSDLNVSAKQIADIPLGTTLSVAAKDYVDVTASPESADQLTFEWVGEPISGATVGQHQATVRVTSQNFNQSVDVVINYKVLYSNSIVMGTDPLVALSLLDDGGVPKLVATPGTAKNELTLRPLLNVYRDSMTNVLVSLQTSTVYQTPDQLATTWNGLIKSATIEYGDVITASGTKKDSPTWQLSGSETYTSRNEVLVKEAEGQTEAFYELTPNGYSLLHVNWLKPQVQEIEQGTTEAELDQRINEFLSTENYNELSVKEFEMYPDTSKLGGSMAVISVVETLKSGKTFAYSHTVPFIVKAPKLTLAADLTVENLSRSEEETNVGDELLYFYTLTNNSSVASLKSGNLSIELPDGLEVVTRSEQNVSIDELAPGKTFTYQVKVKVTDAALNQNPVVKVTGKATNESSVEQDIPEASIEVPGGIVNEIDTSEINLTIPTKMNFGSDEEKIISPVYKMENNSTVPVEVSVEQFTPDTELKDKNLLLKIVADGQPVTLYENNQEINRAHLLLTLDAQEIKQVSFEGSVNKQTDVSKSSSNMRLRFKSTK
ncbi:hypothetical protein IGK28_001590 [Enterococcus sp. DIV0182]|uniref:COG1470 family protein n=1 Tax=Enterococcus sp. DIV0182 TaxID=2774820 RepID=UPI003F1F6D4B